MILQSAWLLLAVGAMGQVEIPPGTRGCLDKGCWGIEPNRYGPGIPAALEKYADEQYAVLDCTPSIPVDMCSACPLNIENLGPQLPPGVLEPPAG